MDEIPYSEFINKELICFSMADNIRSIPSVADGLKPGQRKVIWSCFKRKLKKEIRVRSMLGPSKLYILNVCRRSPNLLVTFPNTRYTITVKFLLRRLLSI